MGKKAHFQVLVWFRIKIFLDCRRIWLTLDGEERNVVQRSLQFVSDSMELMEVARSKISMQISLLYQYDGQRRCTVPSSSGIDIIDGETESDETPPVLKENAEIYTRKISQLVNMMCSQQTCSKLVNKL